MFMSVTVIIVLSEREDHNFLSVWDLSLHLLREEPMLMSNVAGISADWNLMKQ